MFKKCFTTFLILALTLIVVGCGGGTETPSNLAALEEANVALTEVNKTLERTNATLTENNTALQEANGTLQEANKTLETSIATLKEANKTLKEENATLTENNTALQEAALKQSTKLRYEEVVRILGGFTFRSGNEDSISSRTLLNLQFLEAINRVAAAHAVPVYILLSNNVAHVIVAIPVSDREDPVYVDLGPKDDFFVPKEVSVEIGKQYFKENDLAINPTYTVQFFTVIW